MMIFLNQQQDENAMDNFFAEDNNAQLSSQQQQQQQHDYQSTQRINDSDEIFSGMDLNNENPYDHNDNNNNLNINNNEEKKQDNYLQKEEPTILDVWQEQRREVLKKRGEEENILQKEYQQTAKKDLQDFNQQRKQKVENAHKAAKSREKDIRDDYQSVYEHGTVWQQVAKLVDLQNNSKVNTERMRSLLIDLKNDSDKNGGKILKNEKKW